MNKKIRGGIEKGVQDANRRSGPQKFDTPLNDSPAKPPLCSFTHNGQRIEGEIQITRELVEYWAERVWRAQNPNHPERFMPNNWVGIYVIGDFLKAVVNHP